MMNSNKQKKDFLLLRSNADSNWADEHGSYYQYGSNVPNNKRIQSGVKVIVERKEKSKQIFFIGYAMVNKVSEHGTDEKGNTLFHAYYDNFIEFNEPIQLTDNIKAKIQEVQGFNQQYSIKPLTENLFNEIIQLQNISDFDKLWNDFLEEWPLERLKNMTIEEYTNVGDQNTFTYWLESKLDQMGSIWGGSSFKFGIYNRKDKKDMPSEGGRTYDDNYAWYSKYGQNSDETFKNIRSLIIKIIEASKSKNYGLIDSIDLGESFKWKIAFHYQNKDNPGILCVFKSEVLQYLTQSAPGTKMSAMYKILIEQKDGNVSLLDYSHHLWEKWTKTLKIWKISHGKDDFTTADREKYLNNCIIVVHPKTKKGQGKLFTNEMKQGDYFYLCHGNDDGIQLLGKIISDTEPLTHKDDTEWCQRHYQVIRKSLKFDKYEGVKKGWSPNYNSTCKIIPANELGLFEKNILHPYFDLNLTELTETLSEDIVPDVPSELLNIPDLIEIIEASNLQFSNDMILRFLSSLTTKPFLLLTGLSGSGKTKLAQVFSNCICKDKTQYELIAVGADWTSNENLLGYPDALNPGVYRKPDNGALDLILCAKNDPEYPYFLILDEMNLSHVERYFADFLSAMESEEAISLHDDTGADWPAEVDGEKIVPAKLKIPENLFVIGTVNVDETTYMFSPKVLDRANVIEFRVSDEEMKTFLTNPVKPNLKGIAGKGEKFAKDFISEAKRRDVMLDENTRNNVSEVLMKFFPELQKVGAEFGYRSAHEICRFIYFYKKLSEDFDFDSAMDAAIMQKLLPKLHGSKKKLGPVIEALLKLCASDGTHTEGEEDKGKYPVSMEKLKRMQERLQTHGFTSFAEA